MKKILITGNKGFIGTHLESKLKELGYETKGFDLKQHPLEDIRNINSFDSVCENFKPNIIIHLAALAGVRNSDIHPNDYLTTNIIGVRNVLDVAKKYFAKVLFASSSSVYGDQEGPLKEEDVVYNQLSLYAMTKRVGEDLCKYYRGVQTIAFRPFTVYGENCRTDMVVGKLLNAGKNNEVFFRYGKGTSSRGYTHVDDLIDGIVKLIDYTSDSSNFDVFNLGGIESIKLNELIKIIKGYYPKLVVKELGKHYADVDGSFADISKARIKLGWKPTREFTTEIEKLCEKVKVNNKTNK